MNPTTVVTGPQAPPKPRGRGRVWLAAALAVVLLAGGFLAGWFIQSSVGAADPPAVDAAKGETFVYGNGGDIPELKVSSGDCATSPLRKDRSILSTSDCDDKHDFQVFAPLRMFDDGSDAAAKVGWPDVARLRALGESFCGLVFRSGILTQENTNELEFVTLLPSKSVWEDTTSSGSRVVMCAVQRKDGAQFSGSLLPDR